VSTLSLHIESTDSMKIQDLQLQNLPTQGSILLFVLYSRLTKCDCIIIIIPVNDREDKGGHVDPRIWHEWLDLFLPKVLSCQECRKCS